MTPDAAMALVGVLVIAGSLILVALGWLIWRQENQHETLTLHMGRLTQDVHSGMRLIMRNTEAMAQQAQAQKNAPAAEAKPFTPAQLNQLVTAMRRALPPPSASEPRAAASEESAAELKRVHAQKGKLEGELEVLREQLYSQLQQMAQQRRDAQAAVQAMSNSAALRDINEKLLDEVREARQRNQELESSMDPVMTELRIVREQLTALMGAPGLAGTDLEQAVADAAERSAAVHQTRVAELERQLDKAQADAMKVKDELSRTLREKSFIEDQYLSLEKTESEAAALA